MRSDVNLPGTGVAFVGGTVEGDSLPREADRHDERQKGFSSHRG